MRRRLGAWLGIWALLLHGLAPAGASPSGAAPAAGPEFGPVVICTAFGPRLLPAPAPAQDAPRAAAVDHCVLCLSGPAGKLAPSSTVALPLPPAASQPARPQGADAAPAATLLAGVLARGPPPVV